MTQVLGALLVGILIGVVAAAGLLIWWDRRRAEDAADVAPLSSGGKGEEL